MIFLLSSYDVKPRFSRFIFIAEKSFSSKLRAIRRNMSTFFDGFSNIVMAQLIQKAAFWLITLCHCLSVVLVWIFVYVCMCVWYVLKSIVEMLTLIK